MECTLQSVASAPVPTTAASGVVLVAPYCHQRCATATVLSQNTDLTCGYLTEPTIDYGPRRWHAFDTRSKKCILNPISDVGESA